MNRARTARSIGTYGLVATLVALTSLAHRTGSAQDLNLSGSRAADEAPSNGEVRGGGAQADFDSLIDLIVSTIAPDTWDDVGGEGSVMGFPGGVFVDPSGVLRRLDRDVQHRLGTVWDATRITLRRAHAETDVAQYSELRKVSLRRLEQALRQQANEGATPSPELRFMAGLHRLDFVVVDAQNHDVILAGPAGAWTIGPQGRVVNQQTGRPVLRLDDLITLLRNAFLREGRFVCSITPTEERLAATRAFISRTSGSPLTPSGRDEWLDGLQGALGNQQVEIAGIDADTRVARVIVEADHHMKLIGIGLEPGTDQVVSYLDRIEIGPHQAPPDLGVLRWWFTLRDGVVRRNAEGAAFHLAPRMVRVLSENELLTRLGKRIQTGKSDALNEAFARSFTRHFLTLARQYPIYAELDNVFRLATVATLLKHENIPEELDWKMTHFLAEGEYSIPRARIPREVTTVVNHRVINRKHVVAAVSGGVSFQPRDLLTSGLDTSPERINYREWLGSPNRIDEWWWD